MAQPKSKNHDAYHYFSRLPLFKELAQKEVNELAGFGSVRELDRGDVLFAAGTSADHVFIVLLGSLKLNRAHAEGRERIVHFLLNGDIFGAAVALNGGDYPLSAVALELSQVLQIPKDIFASSFLDHPKLGRALMGQITERMKQAHDDRIAVFDSTEKRIASFLVELLDRISRTYGPTTQLTVPLTRQDIADRVGTTVETVIRVLSLWSKKCLITTKGRHIAIPDKAALFREAGLDDGAFTV